MRGTAACVIVLPPMPPTPDAQPPADLHLPAIDGLRALAVLLVMIHHAPLVFGAELFPELFVRASRLAWCGVDLFFVISGFLITGILLRARGRPGAWRRFWIRRALRIFPLGYLYLGFLLWCGQQSSSFLPAGIREPGDWVWYFTYLTNLRVALHGWPGGGLNLLWSLAAEEQFYLLWPLVVLFLPPVWAARVVVATIGLSPLLRLGTWSLADAPIVATYTAPWCRMDALALGAGLALLQDRGAPVGQWASRGAPLGAVTFAALLAAAMLGEGREAPRDSLLFVGLGYLALGGVCTILVAAALRPAHWLRTLTTSRLAQWVGRRSYGIYIWQTAVGIALAAWARRWVPEWGGFELSLVWALLLALVAAASWSVWERPFLALKDRLAPEAG